MNELSDLSDLFHALIDRVSWRTEDDRNEAHAVVDASAPSASSTATTTAPSSNTTK
jgi:hypothetical protein